MQEYQLHVIIHLGKVNATVQGPSERKKSKCYFSYVIVLNIFVQASLIAIEQVPKVPPMCVCVCDCV